MYTVYHIPSKQYVGCTNNLERRMSDWFNSHDVGLNQVEVLWQTDDILSASLMEKIEQLRIFGKCDPQWYHKNHSEEYVNLRRAGISRMNQRLVEQKAHIFQTMVRTPDHNKHIGESNKGKSRPLSEDHRKKISKALMGNKYSLGYVHSEETRKKMSESRRGRQLSDEARKNISEGLSRIPIIKCQYCDFECKSTVMWSHVKCHHPEHYPT